jgi:Family of unknown function (DUF6326)
MRTEERPLTSGDGTRAAWGRRSKLTVLWVFVTLNYAYCDVLALMDQPYLKEVLTGNVGGIEMTRGYLLGASILVEIPMAMVLLSWVLRPGASRIASIIAGVVMTLVQVGSLLVGGSPTPSYAFFSAIEIATTAFIVWYAWTWPARETHV